MSSLDPSTRYEKTKRITFIGALINIVLAGIKILFGIVGHSHALLADGIHSVADLLTDALVLCAAHYGNRAADHDHPYGHGRIETAGTMLLALLLLLSGIGIIIDAGQHLSQNNAAVVPSKIVLLIAMVSIVANEILFRYSLRLAKVLNSSLLNANAWHHRSDAAASLVVLVGIIGALIGFTWCDVIAAIIVGLLIIKMSVELGWSSMRELVDTGLDNDTLQRIRTVIAGVSGVRSVHQLRTRTMGHAVLADVHILVLPFLSVSEGHFISQQVYLALKQDMPLITDVTVHIDPEDDELSEPSSHLPSREKLLPQLKASWATLPGADHITSITLHYLAGKISLELRLPLSVLNQKQTAAELVNIYRKACLANRVISRVDLYFEPE